LAPHLVAFLDKGLDEKISDQPEKVEQLEKLSEMPIENVEQPIEKLPEMPIEKTEEPIEKLKEEPNEKKVVDEKNETPLLNLHWVDKRRKLDLDSHAKIYNLPSHALDAFKYLASHRNMNNMDTILRTIVMA
jgi:hypothetical protein